MPVSYQYHYLQKSAFFCCVHVIVAGIETLFLLLTEGILLLTEGKFFLRVLSQVHKKLGGGVVPSSGMDSKMPSSGLICKVYSTT